MKKRIAKKIIKKLIHGYYDEEKKVNVEKYWYPDYCDDVVAKALKIGRKYCMTIH